VIRINPLTSKIEATFNVFGFVARQIQFYC
jgi:hypothetical protein